MLPCHLYDVIYFFPSSERVALRPLRQGGCLAEDIFLMVFACVAFRLQALLALHAKPYPEPEVWLSDSLFVFCWSLGSGTALFRRGIPYQKTFCKSGKWFSSSRLTVRSTFGVTRSQTSLPERSYFVFRYEEPRYHHAPTQSLY